ncbi:MAG: hypothetical protein GC179_03805 [Anaerolineaceae bacterium]|nr:hypothetical protein [Anaerolineaceae bacterium]
MQISLDVVDLLQLQEIWSRRPIVTAFTRLETRSALRPSPDTFKIEDLLPRLSRLKRSPAWLSRRSAPTITDPARIPLGDLSDDYLLEMYPEAESAAVKRSTLFLSVYNCYLVAHYDQSVTYTAAALQLLARVRHLDSSSILDSENLPAQGSPEWIPLNITDEIRSLDDRYDAAEPGAPAAYVVAEDFWPLLLKAASEDFESAAKLAQESADTQFCDVLLQVLTDLSALAHTWYRSPSVVGLCYRQQI